MEQFFIYLKYIACLLLPLIFLLFSENLKNFRKTSPGIFAILYLVFIFETGAYEWATSWASIGSIKAKEVTISTIENNPVLKENLEAIGENMDPGSEKETILDYFK